MLVDNCCQALLAQTMSILDPLRSKTAIDIGVGTFAFYCEVFSKLGYQTIAVEPMPSTQLRKLCRIRGIQLVESCISGTDGYVDFFIGTWKGQENHNLNSIRQDWWGSSSHSKRVPSKTLPSLLEEVNVRGLSCVKIDVEGLEWEIIQQFRNCSMSLLPNVLMFEYGGGATRESGECGWADDTFDGTMNSLKTMRDLGYNQAIVVDFSNKATEKIVDLQTSASDPEAFFEDYYVYGNIIALHKYHLKPTDINAICKPYRDHEVDAPAIRLKESYVKRMILHVRQLYY